MRFQRIEDNIFNCLILNDELRELNIDPFDLESDKDHLMECVIREAVENGIIDENAGPRQMDVKVSTNPIGIILQCHIIESDTSELRDMIASILQRAIEQAEANETAEYDESEYENVGEQIPLILEFRSLTDVISFCKRIIHKQFSESTLYKHDHKYFMIVDTEDAETWFYNASEQAVSCYVNPFRSAYIQEHGKLITKECVPVLAYM